jgi:hypothetical protein
MRPGVYCPADREGAAKRIVDGTHRLASPEEVAAERRKQELRGGAMTATERLRNNLLSFQLPAGHEREK